MKSLRLPDEISLLSFFEAKPALVFNPFYILQHRVRGEASHFAASG